jgi:hypothetical protein
VIGTIGVVTNLISGTAKPFIGKVQFSPARRTSYADLVDLEDR